MLHTKFTKEKLNPWGRSVGLHEQDKPLVWPVAFSCSSRRSRFFLPVHFSVCLWTRSKTSEHISTKLGGLMGYEPRKNRFNSGKVSVFIQACGSGQSGGSIRLRSGILNIFADFPRNVSWILMETNVGVDQNHLSKTKKTISWWSRLFPATVQ